MNIHEKTLALVSKEKEYTAKILHNLAIIDRDNLYCDFGYPSLFKYLTKALRYSDSEANIRVAAVKLVNRDHGVTEKIASGKLSLTNAAQVNNSLSLLEKQQKIKPKKETIQRALSLAMDMPTRRAKENLRKEFKLSAPRVESLVLDERILTKLDRARKIYGDISAYELLDILLEEKLKAPKVAARKVKQSPKVSRYIPVSVKQHVWQGKCENCQTKRDLQYDHKLSYSRGGLNSVDNIQVLCGACNRRKYSKGKGYKYV